MTVVLSESLSPELSSALSEGEAPCRRMYPSLGIAHVQWLICGEWIKTRPCVSIRTRVRGIPAPRAPYRIFESCLNSEFALQFSSRSDQSCFPCSLTGKVPRNPDPFPSSHPNLLQSNLRVSEYISHGILSMTMSVCEHLYAENV